MKILLDEDTGKVFAQRLTELLEPDGATVFRSVKVGWRGAKNGDLLTMAANNGYTHLVTADKMMAEETPTTIPVLVVDQMDDASTDRICRTARTVALLLFQNASKMAGYYAVFVDGYEPSKRLRRIAEGRHKMSPALVKYRRRI